MSHAPESTAHEPFPGPGQTLVLMLVFLLVAGVVQVPAFLLEQLGVHRGRWVFFLLSQAAGTAMVLWMAHTWGNRSWRDCMPFRPVSPWIWPGLVLATLGLLLCNVALDTWLCRVLPEPAWLGKAIQDGGWPAIVLGAPLSEECLFRGIVLGAFLQRYPKGKAVALSAFFFTLMHLNPWQVLAPMTLGLLAGWLVAETGSLWPALAVHALNNGLAFAAPERWEAALATWRGLAAGTAIAGIGFGWLLTALHHREEPLRS